MTKFFKTTILLATILMLSITSCISEHNFQPPTPIEPDTERTVLLRIVQSAATRGVNRPLQDNEPLALLTGDLYLVHQTGVISHHFRVVAADDNVTYLTDANLAAKIIHRNLLDDGVSLPGVPGTVTTVVMVGNYHGANSLPTEGDHVDLVGSRVLDIISQHDSQGNTLGVNLFGEDELTLLLDGAGQPVLSTDGNPIFTASVFLRPTVARFEIADITAAGSITAFTIDGIFLDGFYRQMAIDGTLAPNATPFLSGDVSNAFSGTSHAFDTNFAVHDWRAGQNWTGRVDSSLVVRAGGVDSWHCVVANETLTRNNVWGYQVFARSHAHTYTIAPPNIIIRLSGIVSSCGSDFPSPQFITVGGLVHVVNGVRVPLEAILASRVYRIPAGGLVFDEHDLSPHPNELEIEVQVEIELDVWEPDELAPYIPLRQPNPQSANIAGNETHTFRLGAAWGGGCLNPVVYLWEQSADGINWVPAYGINNEASYTTTYLSHSMYFRRKAIRCGVTIISEPALVSIELWTPSPAEARVCYGDTHTFSLGASVGGSGAFSYQWQSSADGVTFTDISGETGQYLTIDALTVSTYFRRVATDANLGGTIISDHALVTVYNMLVTPHPVASSVMVGTTHTFNLGAATGGSGAFSYQWQSSAGGVTFTDISGATGQNLSTVLTADTYFRRVATNACGYVVSNSARVIVRDVYSVYATIHGIHFATRNLDYPNTFAAHPQSAGRFYQWGTIAIGGASSHWPATGNITGWDSWSPRHAWCPGVQFGFNNDPCPPGWRVPTASELSVLVDAGSTQYDNWNDTGVPGRVFPIGATPEQVLSSSPTAIFLPAAGWRDFSGSLQSHWEGIYWSSSSSSAIEAISLYFIMGDNALWVCEQGSSVAQILGLPIRCVRHQAGGDM